MTYLHLFIFKFNVFCSYVLWMHYYYFCGCCNKSPQTRRLETTNFSLTVLEPEVWGQCQWVKIKMLAGMYFLWRFWRKTCSLPLQLLTDASILWLWLHHSNLCVLVKSPSYIWCKIQENIEEGIAFCLFLLRILAVAFRALRGNSGQLSLPWKVTNIFSFQASELVPLVASKQPTTVVQCLS